MGRLSRSMPRSQRQRCALFAPVGMASVCFLFFLLALAWCENPVDCVERSCHFRFGTCTQQTNKQANKQPSKQTQQCHAKALQKR